MSSGEQNEWSIAWILFCSSFFFLFLCMISVCAHQCMYNSSALGRGNWERQEAVAKGRESGEEVNAPWLLLPSFPPSLSPCADGLSRVQLCFVVLWLSTKSYLFALSVTRKHIRNSHWSGPPSAERPNYWQVLSIKLHSVWKQQDREMGLEQNQNMSRHWYPLALFLLDTAACLCGISH